MIFRKEIYPTQKRIEFVGDGEFALPSPSVRFYIHMVHPFFPDLDPDAVWMMQGWLFLDQAFWGFDQIKALLNSVSK